MSRILEIVAAVVADLAVRDLGRPATVEARKLPRYKKRAARDSTLPSLERLCVYVAPATRTPERIARGVWQKDFGLNVGFLQNVPAVGGLWDDDEVDRLINLVEDVEDYFSQGGRLSTLATARYLDARTDPVFDEEFLQTKLVFGSTIQVTVRQAPA